VKGMRGSARHKGYGWPAIAQMRLTGGDGSGASRGKAAAVIRALGRRCWDERVQGMAQGDKKGRAGGLGERLWQRRSGAHGRCGGAAVAGEGG
jgi:hypothetical protein